MILLIFAFIRKQKLKKKLNAVFRKRKIVPLSQRTVINNVILRTCFTLNITR